MKLSVKYKNGSKVKHLPSGKIIKIESMTKVFVRGKIIDTNYPDYFSCESTKVRINECEPYIETPKEKTPYEKMRERNMEDAKKLTPIPEAVGQHILWLKMAVIDRVEKIDNKISKEIYTFRKKENGDEFSKFGFSEHYVNILMHYAYEAGKNNATERLTRNFEERIKQSKTAIDAIIDVLDNNGLLPENDCNY
jgi:hypothetical protein